MPNSKTTVLPSPPSLSFLGAKSFYFCSNSVFSNICQGCGRGTTTAKSPVEQEGGRDLFSKGLQSTYYELLALLDFRGLSHSFFFFFFFFFTFLTFFIFYYYSITVVPIFPLCPPPPIPPPRLSHSYLRQSSKQERRDAKEGFSSRVRAMKL